MIKMVDKQSIIFLYRRGCQSLREISKTLNLHRATVTKVIREYEESLKADNPDAALDTVLTTLPGYKSNDRPARVVKGEVATEIDKWLAENERRRMKGMRKQCLNAKDIHRQLLEKDLVASYSSVCKYIARVKALCSALVDRLCHKAFLVNMSGASYRVKETQKMLNNLL